MTRLLLILFVPAVAGLVACSGAKPQGHASIGMTSNDSLFIVNEGPFSFGIFLPKDGMINHQPLLKMNHATGEMYVMLGHDFRLVALAERVSREQLQTEIADDGMFTNRVESEQEGVIIYQQYLPTGESWYFQVIGQARVGGQDYLFRSEPMGEYTLQQAERMASAIRRLSGTAI